MYKRLCLISTLICLITGSAGAAFYDPAFDFSAANNPNGVWSYGFRTTTASAFTLSESPRKYETIMDGWWMSSTLPYYPTIQHNGTAAEFNNGSGYIVAPGGLSMHPGSYGELADLRFTAPAAGTYSIVGAFSSTQRQYLHYPGATTDVHLFLNNGEIVGTGGFITQYGDIVNFSKTLTLAAGDTLDFLVGYGQNGNYYGDSTGLQLSITTVVPEPSTILAGALLLLPFAGGLVRRLRKH